MFHMNIRILIRNRTLTATTDLKILRIPYTRHVSNAEVRRTTGCSLLSHLVTNRHLRLFGHIARSSPREDHHRALAACIRQVPPDWKRPAGRPSHTWFCAIKADLLPSELWPRNCLEKGHYSRWMATYCEHSNAPVEYALKEEEDWSNQSINQSKQICIAQCIASESEAQMIYACTDSTAAALQTIVNNSNH